MTGFRKTIFHFDVTTIHFFSLARIVEALLSIASVFGTAPLFRSEGSTSECIFAQQLVLAMGFANISKYFH
jgi:hypothetical protein